MKNRTSEKEINLTQVDTGAIVGDIAKIIFGIIYDAKKFRYGKCDFPFDQMVDNTMYGIATGGMRLRFLDGSFCARKKIGISPDEQLQMAARRL